MVFKKHPPKPHKFHYLIVELSTRHHYLLNGDKKNEIQKLSSLNQLSKLSIHVHEVKM